MEETWFERFLAWLCKKLGHIECTDEDGAVICERCFKLLSTEYSRSKAMKHEFYTDEAGEHRWRIVAGNGNIIADSGEGYTNKFDCEHGFELVQRYMLKLATESE